MIAQGCCASEQAIALATRAAWAVLAGVPDPEVPALSVVDLGIVRDVVCSADGALDIVLTPTYSGCPATEAIEADIRAALALAGLGTAHIRYRLAPAWTSDWISAEGRLKLAAYGIAPPGCLLPPGRLRRRPPEGASSPWGGPAATRADDSAVVRVFARNVACPRCASARTERLSAFGSTACKSMHRCLDCREPFEYFKPI